MEFQVQDWCDVAKAKVSIIILFIIFLLHLLKLDLLNHNWLTV